MKAAHNQNEQNERDQLPPLAGESRKTLKLTQQTAPRRQRFRDSEAENPKIGLGQNKNWHRNPELRIKHRLQVRHQMPPQQAKAVAARGSRQKNEIRLRERPC